MLTKSEPFIIQFQRNVFQLLSIRLVVVGQDVWSVLLVIRESTVHSRREDGMSRVLIIYASHDTPYSFLR